MHGLNALKLSHRFAILIGIVVLGFAAYGGWSFKTLSDLKVNGPLYQRIALGKDLVADILPPPEYILESYLVTLQLSSETDSREQDKLIDRLKVLKREYDKQHEFWRQADLGKELEEVFLKRAHEPAAAFYGLAFDSLVPALRQGNKDAVAAAMTKMKIAYGEHRLAIDEVVQIAQKRTEADESDARQRIDSATMLMLAILAVAMITSIAVSTAITRGLLASLGGEPSYAVEVSRTIAAGDLTMAIDTRPGDRTSLLAEMKQMQSSLKEVIRRTHDATAQLVDASQALASASQQVAESSGQQSEAAASMAASVEQMSASIAHVSSSANDTRTISNEAGILSQEGADLVRGTIAEMNNISVAVEQSTQLIHQLGEQSDKITGIVNVIKEIADQTNLLALNAAIEAARAGEQGRGFAVVADEVRKLAEKTTLSTQEIATMIAAIQQGTHCAVQGMEDGGAKVRHGVAMASQTGDTMDRIEAGAKKVQAAVDEISNALREHGASSGAIAANVEKIAQMTEENSAAVSEVSRAATDLKQLATTLQANVDRFRT
ncbi:MAG TPA: methyl-accepting chemotaxis protein [Rhodocyclaceae bacterium]|nr:methyl-accepting chemotaxis protein [Rhodocyclaceae bacterium]